MTRDPYKPPGSDPNNSPPTINSAAWIVVSVMWVLITALGLVTIPYSKSFTVFDLLSHSVNVVASVGLLGFAFYKPIYQVAFWRYFFYVAILDFVVNGFFVAGYEISRPGIEIPEDFFIKYAVGMVFNLVVIYGINQYAYKRPFIWKQ